MVKKNAIDYSKNSYVATHDAKGLHEKGNRHIV